MTKSNNLMAIDRFTWLAVALATLECAALGQTQRPLFANQQFPCGGGVSDVATADFNGDGHVDWAAVGSQNSELVVGFGAGSGSTASTLHIPVDGALNLIAVADFDGDGHIDIALTDDQAPSVLLLLGTGSGTFTGPRSFALATYLDALVAVDLDRDGDVDLLGASTPDSISLLFNDGAGSFPIEARYWVGAFPVALAVGDVSGDGLLDVVTANSGDSTATVLFGCGIGELYTASSIALPGIPLSLALDDLDGDGQLDLALALGGPNEVHVFHGDGLGSFTPLQVVSIGDWPVDVALVDLDADGRLDLATVNGSGSLSTARSTAPGMLGAVSSTPLGSWPFAMTFADLDEDGHPDALVADYAGRAVDVARGDGHGGLDIAPRVATGDAPCALAAGDFDGDGAVDVAIARRYLGDVELSRGNGAGGLEPASAIGIVAIGPNELVAADLDHDGNLDLSAVGATGITSLRGNGAGAFQPMGGALLSTDYDRRGVLADFDGDGNADWVVSKLAAGSVELLRGDGTGSFASSASFAAGTYPHECAAADFDGDGALDVVVLDLSHAISVLLGDGHGQFAAPVTTAVPQAIRELAIGDFDENGRADVAVCDPSAQLIGRLLGDGHGGFAAPSFFACDIDPSCALIALRAADLDADGHQDLIAAVGDYFANAYPPSDPLLVRFGDGAGDFGALQQFGVGMTPFALSVCDLDGNGRLDLVAAGFESNDLTVLLNRLPPFVASYCTAGTSSNGCVAELSATGFAHVGAPSGFVLTASGLEGLRNATIFYGISGTLNLPWGTGSTSWLCVQPPVARTGLVNAGGTLSQCDGSLAFDWSSFVNAHPGSLGTPFTAGANVWAQAWFRDPPAPHASSLSNGLRFTLVP